MISDDKPNFVALSDDGRLDAPAAARNREPILAVLRTVMPPAGTLLHSELIKRGLT